MMEREPFISFFEEKEEFWFPEGCYIIENLNTDRDPALSVAQARVPPGVATAWHRLHDTTERYVILGGTGMVEAGDMPAAALKPGDVLVIPPGIRQRIRNMGSDDLIFLALCTPRFRPDNYESLEQAL
jgi:mannose-6-phosphate isomerase-like protein (cupin superfamily)